MSGFSAFLRGYLLAWVTLYNIFSLGFWPI